MKTKSSTLEHFFLLCAICLEALNFAIWLCSLKKGHGHIVKATGLVFSKYDSTCLRIEIPMRIKTEGHELTHRVVV